jgi:hypothetical protein
MQDHPAPSDVFMIEAAFNTRLESIACEIERRQGNKVYMAAWRVAARIVREHKRSEDPKAGALSAREGNGV